MPQGLLGETQSCAGCTRRDAVGGRVGVRHRRPRFGALEGPGEAAITLNPIPSESASVCICAQIRCLGEAEMAPVWVVALAGSPPWVGELPLKLDPTTGGGNAFWETDSGCQCTRRGRAAKSRPSGVIFFWPIGWPGTRGGPPWGLNGAPESVLAQAGPHTSSPVVAGQSTAGSPNAQNPTRHRRPGRPRLLFWWGKNGFQLPKGGSWWAPAALLSSEWPKKYNPVWA